MRTERSKALQQQPERSLPDRRNPLIEPENSPSYEILVERRRLGQTNLILKAGQSGLTNASKPENTGYFDYAHLRVPLPKDLSGSGIFTLTKTTSYPESYFLMRRSSDGYISATGMFKAGFPWASQAESEIEARHHKSLSSAGTEEVAGSIWISPEDALQLAEDYGMRTWIIALLDPEPIEKGNKDKGNKSISTPPRFEVSQLANPLILPPSSAVRSTRSRTSRSVSPSKIATPSRKIASPRKSRSTRSAAKAEPAASEVPSRLAPVELEPSEAEKPKENGALTEGSVASESINGESVKIEVQETVEQNGDIETTTTNVRVDLPADAPEIPLPESPEDLIAKAKEMVEEANRLEGRASGSKSSKRKADELDVDEEDDKVVVQPAKKVKILAQEVKKERVTTKALIGLSAVAAIGTAIQYFF